jgi:hypothetical protein
MVVQSLSPSGFNHIGLTGVRSLDKVVVDHAL